MSKAFLKFIISNLDEMVPIHPTINPACIHRPISKHVSPHYYRSTSTHHYTLNLGATGRRSESSGNLGATGGALLTAGNLGSADRDALPESEVSVHCSSGIDTKRGDICGMISLWQGAAVTQDIATVIGGREDFGPDWNASVSFDQSTAGFMLRSQGRPRTIGADGWS